MKVQRFHELKTNRLLLRKLSKSDWESISYLRSNKVVNQFVKREVADTREKALAFIQKTNSKINNRELFYWCITLKDNSEMIGSICLWNFSEDKKTAEIGYDLKPDYQGKGIMTESIQEVLEFGFHKLDLDKIEAFTQRNNESSIRLLKKNLFRLNKGKVDTDNLENLIFEINRPTKTKFDLSWNKN